MWAIWSPPPCTNPTCPAALSSPAASCAGWNPTGCSAPSRSWALPSTISPTPSRTASSSCRRPAPSAKTSVTPSAWMIPSWSSRLPPTVPIVFPLSVWRGKPLPPTVCRCICTPLRYRAAAAACTTCCASGWKILPCVCATWLPSSAISMWPPLPAGCGSVCVPAASVPSIIS